MPADFCIAAVERTLPFCTNPEAAASIEGERVDRAGSRADFFGTRQVAAKVKPAVLTRRLRAIPGTALGIHRDGLHEKRSRAAQDFFYRMPLYRQQASAASANQKHFV
jgi:hypothetical protein